MQSDTHQHSNADIQTQVISQALDATLDPQSSNETRQDALKYLEQIKSRPDAPLHGFVLAHDLQQAQAIRYYGTQLLEHAVKYQWNTYDGAQIEQLYTWITTLALDITEQDAAFYRNKVGQLWVECAKRSWGDEWFNMDNQLLQLWENSAAQKQPASRVLVLYIIEMLAEDICNKEDATAGLRLEILGNALNEIVIPQQLYRSHMELRGKSKLSELRAGHEGWLARICNFVAHCIKQTHIEHSKELQSFKTCAFKGISALKALVSWTSLKAVIEVNLVDCLSLALHIQDVDVRIAAVETMYTIVPRTISPQSQESQLHTLKQIVHPEQISLLASIFNNDTPSEDEDTYTLQKKASELVSEAVGALFQYHPTADAWPSIEALFPLLLAILQNQSLVVSIPVLHSWTKLLSSKSDRLTALLPQALGTLVEVCSQRLLNFEMLPEDTDILTVQTLYRDFETMPERHAFLGNYRRYCVNILETIAKLRPLDAITHVFRQTLEMLTTGPFVEDRGLNIKDYKRTFLPILQFDAQYSVLLSVTKGYAAWEVTTKAVAQDNSTRPQIDELRQKSIEAIQQWCLSAVNLNVQDPEVASHLLAILSNIGRNTTAGRDVILPIVQFLLSTQLVDRPTATSYMEAVKGFEALRVLEIQKIALRYPDELFEYYDNLDGRVKELISSSDDDERIIWSYKAFLFIIVQRTSRIDDVVRMNKLRQMLEPVYQAWHSEAVQQASASMDSFCDLLGLGDLAVFYEQHNFARVDDWASQQLDLQGQSRQTGVKNGLDQIPLRRTKSMLAATLERLDENAGDREMASALWAPSIEVILPSVLRLIKHAQAFNNPATWSHLPAELQAVFKRTLQDRFWQSGISNETRDEFYARINGSKSSYEGFASSVRGSIRNVREQGYHIVFLLTKFGQRFYGMPDLPEAIADALFSDAASLSTQHLQPLINLATGLLQGCPHQYRSSFLPPILIQLFVNMDLKISNEWDNIVRINGVSADDDDLSEEMRIESVLRQLTWSMVSFVNLLLESAYTEQKRTLSNNLHTDTASAAAETTQFVLRDVSILEPLIMFCTHALRVRDTRCCTSVCKLLTNMLPAFVKDIGSTPQVREFISTEVLKAGISSLNEPYFADTQKDFATLLARIIELYSPKTTTPREVLLSIPNMPSSRVDDTIAKIRATRNTRQQRALVLDLLEGVRGVSIHESGKIARQPMLKPKVQAQYMEVEQKPSIFNGDEAGLEGISGLFGDA